MLYICRDFYEGSLEPLFFFFFYLLVFQVEFLYDFILRCLLSIAFWYRIFEKTSHYAYAHQYILHPGVIQEHQNLFVQN